MICALAWVALTGWWLLRLRPPAHRPGRELRRIEIPGPRWLRIGLTVLCVPVVLGVLAILARNGVSVPVLLGAIVGPGLGVLIHRRRLRNWSSGARLSASPPTHTTQAREKTE